MRQCFMMAVVAALVAASGVQAQNQGGGPPRGGRGGGGMQNLEVILPPAVVDQLALTADQQTNLKGLTAQYLKDREALLAKQKSSSNDVAQVRQDMQATRDAGDQAKMRELRGKLNELMQPQTDLQTKYRDQFRGTLTDDQKKKLDDALQQMMLRRGGRRGGAGGGAGGPPPAPPAGGGN